MRRVSGGDRFRSEPPSSPQTVPANRPVFGADAEPDGLRVRPKLVVVGIRVFVIANMVAIVLAGCASTTAGPVPSSSSFPPASAAGTQVSGAVVGEPGCPGPVRLGTPCPAIAMPGATVEADEAGHSVAKTTTGAGGRFALNLPPGSYTLTATAAAPLRSRASRALLVGTSPVSVTLTVDTGIR